jgi:hypothetical protein
MTQIIKESAMQDKFNKESTCLINKIDGALGEIVSTRRSNPYLHAATSDNTRKAYQNDIAHFVSWGGLLPTSPHVIIHYLQAYAIQLNPRTLVRRLTAIKHWHTYQNFPDPTAYPYICLRINARKSHSCVYKSGARSLCDNRIDRNFLC